MKIIKVSEATELQLDWLVAKCLGEHEDETLDPLTWLYTAKPTGCWDFCTNWAQGGPIIEREKITITPLFFMEGGWRANHHNLRYDDMGEYINGSDDMQDGPTPLTAAMRCYCSFKLGDEVEVPEELTCSPTPKND